jgi:hypothetical protein
VSEGCEQLSRAARWIPEQRIHTYIDRNMAYYCRVVGQSDISGIMFIVLALGRARFIVNNESTLDIDSDSPRVQYGLLNGWLRLVGGAARTRRWRTRRYICWTFTGCSRRGVGLRASRGRHGWCYSRPWLQPCPLASWSVDVWAPHAKALSVALMECVMKERGRLC